MSDGNGALVVRDQRTPLSFSQEQRQMIRDVYASGASDPEFQVFMEVARARNLNPLTRQIHLVKRWNSDLGRNVYTPQTGIDGLRAVAERTGLYDGQDEPEFEYDGQTLKLARVRVYRKDWKRPAVGVAHFSEYVQLKKDRSPTHMWAEKPHIMLSKCAEALALRKAFPEDTSGLYTDEEMPAPHEVDVTPRQVVRGVVTDAGPSTEKPIATDATLESDLRASVTNGAAADTRSGPNPVAAAQVTKAPTAGTEAPRESGQPHAESPGQIAGRLVAAIAKIQNPIHWKNWRPAHEAEVDSLPPPLRKAVWTAYANAGPPQAP